MSHFQHRQQPHARPKSKYKDLDPLAARTTQFTTHDPNDDDTDGWTLALQQSDTGRSSASEQPRRRFPMSQLARPNQRESRRLIPYNDLTHTSPRSKNDRPRPLLSANFRFRSNSNSSHSPRHQPQIPSHATATTQTQSPVSQPHPHHAAPILPARDDATPPNQLPPPTALPTLSALSDALNETEIEPVTPTPNIQSWSDDDALPNHAFKPRDGEDSASSGESANPPSHMRMSACPPPPPHAPHPPVLEPLQSWSDDDPPSGYPRAPPVPVPVLPAGEVPLFLNAQAHMPPPQTWNPHFTPMPVINPMQNEFYQGAYSSPSPFAAYVPATSVPTYPAFNFVPNVPTESPPSFYQYSQFSHSSDTHDQTSFEERPSGRGRHRGRGRARGRGHSRGRFRGAASEPPESTNGTRDLERSRGRHSPHSLPRALADPLPEEDRQRHAPISGALYAPWGEIPKRVRDPVIRSTLPLSSKSVHVPGTSIKRQKKDDDQSS